MDALDGRCTVAEAAGQVKQSSRRYAKRQLTWFRRNREMNWILREPEEGTEEILQKARQVLQVCDK